MARSDENGFLRVWNSTTGTNVLSANVGGELSSVSWSGDGRYIGVTKDDDTAHVYYANNMTSVHGTISADVGSGNSANDIDLSAQWRQSQSVGQEMVAQTVLLSHQHDRWLRYPKSKSWWRKQILFLNSHLQHSFIDRK